MVEVVSAGPPPSGDGPAPVLFVHGAWHGAWCWQEHFLPYFAGRGRSAHALDLRGHGATGGRDRLRRTHVGHYLADLVSVAAGFPRAPIVVGHSMGGLVVRRYLADRRPPAAVLLAPVPSGGVLRTALRIARAHPGPFARANLGLRLGPLVAEPHLARWAFFSDEMDPATVDRYHAALQDESYLAFLDMLVDRPRPRPQEVPLLVLGAADDRIFRPDQVERTARRYGVEAEIFPNMAHDMMLEAGWQGVADRILSWLEDVGV